MLRDLPDKGILFGDSDVLVLSRTAFSPGTMFEAALVYHQFWGSWKPLYGA